MVDREEAVRFAENPIAFFDRSYAGMHDLPPVALAALQLSAAQYRVEQLIERVPVLAKLAAAQGITGIAALEDLAPLLFEHTMYKSYPPSLLAKGRYDQLTKWLQRLTTIDLSRVDLSECDSIDSWLDALTAQTPMVLTHSSGTSGIMSFLPLHRDEYHIRNGEQLAAAIRTRVPSITAQGTLEDPLNLYVVNPFFRVGGKAVFRRNDSLAAIICGGEERFLSALPGRASSDVDYLAARMRAAQARGAVEEIEVPQTVLARKAAFDALSREMPQRLATFFDEVTEKLQGQIIVMSGTWNVLYPMAEAGLAKGKTSVFSPESFVQAGGGAKGMTPPPDWEEKVKTFIGVDRLMRGYGMSECSGTAVMCERDHFHIAPWVIAFLLDPDTGKLLPRSGTQTGRYAFFDLLPATHWGGFVTGDEITIDFDTGCACGRKGPFVFDRIERLSEKRGGDDKISCAATPQAVNDALDFLTRLNV